MSVDNVSCCHSASLEHSRRLAAELVPDRALQQALHQAGEDVGEVDLAKGSEEDIMTDTHTQG